MADNEIVAWLRLRDSVRFRRDAKRAEDAIDDIGDAAKRASDGPLNQMGGALGELVGKLPDVTGRTRIFGFAIGTVFTAFVALIPLVVGLGGALVALAGSLGAAALGAGLLGTAIAGLAIPLGALGLVAFGALQGFQKVNTAFTAYGVAVGAYGKNSRQAETALARLHGQISQNGGPVILQAVKAWKSLKEAFQEATKPVLGDLLKMMIGLFGIIRKLLPTFATVAKIASGAVLQAFRSLGSVLTSPQFQSALLTLANAFARMAGPAINTVANFLMGLLSIASRLAPTLGWLFQGVEGASTAFRDWAENGNLGVLVQQFRSWWGLLKSVGGLLFTILSAGSGTGKGLVDTLTKVVNGWNAFLNTKQGQASLLQFFKDAGDMTRAFMSIIAAVTVFLFKFGRALVPIYTVVFKAIRKGVNQLRDALEPMAPFLNNILIPLLKGLAEGVIGSIVGSFKLLIFIVKVVSTVLGALGKLVGPGLKPVFETIGKVIGFFFGGAILKLLSSIGKLNILLRPLGFLFKLLAVPINLAGRAVGFLFGWMFKLLGFAARFAINLFAPLRGAFNRVLGFLIGAGARFYDAGVFLWTRFKSGILKAIGAGLGFAGDIGKGIWNFVAGTFNKFLPDKIKGPGPLPDLNLPDNPLPLLAGGGVISGVGSWITGDAGPELNTLTSGGQVVVKPLTSAISAPASSATLAPGGGKRVLISKIYLKGHQIAEAVADEAEDEAARR